MVKILAFLITAIFMISAESISNTIEWGFDSQIIQELSVKIPPNCLGVKETRYNIKIQEELTNDISVKIEQILIDEVDSLRCIERQNKSESNIIVLSYFVKSRYLFLNKYHVIKIGIDKLNGIISVWSFKSEEFPTMKKQSKRFSRKIMQKLLSGIANSAFISKQTLLCDIDNKN